VELVFTLVVIYLLLEHLGLPRGLPQGLPHLPFRGMLTDEMSDSIKTLGFRHYLVAWLPTWWLILGCSMLSAGVGLGCAIWAVVDQVQGQPVGLPVLIGASALVSAFAGLIVPITLAWFKDRSEQREHQHLKERVHELEIQVEANREGHMENKINIQKVSVATQKIADAAEKIVEAKVQMRSFPPE
jgi:hypothetical protein